MSISLNKPVMLLLIGLLTACSFSTISSDKQELGIMSYNLRFDNPNDDNSSWDNRKARIANLIKYYEPAFIGTQEGLIHQLEYLESELGHYKWIGVGRDDGTMNGEFSALFYDSTRVQLVEDSDTTIWLSEAPSVPSKDWDAAFPRILTFGQFRDKSSGRQFSVFNTHFDHIGDTARAKSAELIVDTIQKTSEEKPVIVTGDFNATPESKPYSILTSGEADLQDAFQISDLPNVGPCFTYEGFEVKSDIKGRRIDYVFVNDKVIVQKHTIISTFRDSIYPSDHLPVLAEIAFKEV